jgi:hypothetical protein
MRVRCGSTSYGIPLPEDWCLLLGEEVAKLVITNIISFELATVVAKVFISYFNLRHAASKVILRVHLVAH